MSAIPAAIRCPGSVKILRQSTGHASGGRSPDFLPRWLFQKKMATACINARCHYITRLPNIDGAVWSLRRLKRMKFNGEAIGISLVPAITLVTGVTAAEDEQSEAVLDEVVVTAQRREEAAHDVPISITTLSADLIEATGATQMRDIAQLTPALRFDSSSAFTSRPSVALVLQWSPAGSGSAMTCACW